MPKPVIEDSAGYRPIRAARGAALSCKGWEQEAALRVFMNSLDAEVAERPEELLVETRRARLARDWKSFHSIVASLETLEDVETLLVQSGQPAEILRIGRTASRVVIADADSPSWFSVGAQQYLPSAWETFALAAQRDFQGTLAGKLVLSAGMSGRGGAVPLAATLNGAAFLGIEADAESVKRRVKAGYCDVMVNNLDEALRILKNAVRKREAASVGLAANPAEMIPELARRGVVPDLLTDHTGARNVIEELPALEAMGAAKLDMTQDPGDGRITTIFAALSGEPADVHRADHLLAQLFPRDDRLSRWLALAAGRVRFEGLPARACRLGVAECLAFALALNDLAARRELKAPIAIGHADKREMRGGLDAVAGGTNQMADRIARALAPASRASIVRFGSGAEALALSS